MPKTVEIQIDGDTGKVVDADRETHVTTKRKGAGGGKDQVKWTIAGGPGGASFAVVFGATTKDPFTAPTTIAVPAGGSVTTPVQGLPGTYKYSVQDSTGKVTDDPNVIIDS